MLPNSGDLMILSKCSNPKENVCEKQVEGDSFSLSFQAIFCSVFCLFYALAGDLNNQYVI